MGRGEKNRRFTRRDYFSLGGAIFLACVIWLIHNLSMTYSEIVRFNIIADTEKDGYENFSGNYSEVAARCEMDGYSMLAAIREGRRKPKHLHISPDDLHVYAEADIGSTFYMTSQELQKYSHMIYGDMCKVEYFLADTTYFFFSHVEYVKVPVVPVTNFEFKAQYMPDEFFKVIPDSVLVYGDVNTLKGIESVSTLPINRKGIDSDIVGEVKLQNVNGLRMSTNKVDYFQSVSRFVEFEERVPVQVINVPQGVNVNIYPSYAVVRLKNYYPVETDPEELLVEIDYNDFRQSRSGYCVAKLATKPMSTIVYELIPEVFECIEM